MRLIGWALNLVLRGTILAFLIETMRTPDDPRFDKKAIPLRNLIVVTALSAVFPARQALLRSRPRPRFPVWADNLYLSIFWLDMAGNHWDLYERYRYFDMLAHFHGGGALAVVLSRFVAISRLSGFGLSNVIHTLLEAQEYYTDRWFGTHNVHGVADHVNDLLSGVAGSVVYTVLTGGAGSTGDAGDRDLIAGD